MPNLDPIANVIVWVFFVVGVITLGWVIVQYVRHPTEREESVHSADWR